MLRHPRPCRSRLTRAAALLACALAGSACSGDDDPPPRDSGVGQAGATSDGGQAGASASRPELMTGVAVGACKAKAEVHAHDSQPAQHVAQPLPSSAYNSRPPSFGPHCGSWGSYKTYTASAPLPACNFVHNLEHGAIALLYRCPDGCPEVVSALQKVIDESPPDPDCGELGLNRYVLTPYADMDTQVAAAAWGYTWTAECLDDDAIESLETFIDALWGSYGDAPESLVCG
jgi:hypothetical protein